MLIHLKVTLKFHHHVVNAAPPKLRNVQKKEAQLFSDLIHEVQWQEGCIVNLNTSKTKTRRFHHHREDISHWEKEQLLNLNTFKPNHLTFHHHREDIDLSPLIRDKNSLKENPCLECLQGLKLRPDLKQKSYIQSSAKQAI